MKRKLFLAISLLLAPACAADSETTEPGPLSHAVEDVGDGVLYVVNGGDRSISVVDLASTSVTATIALEGVDYPHHVYLDDDRLLLAAPGVDLSGGHESGHGAHEGSEAEEDPGPAFVLALDAGTGELLTYHRLGAPNHNAIAVPKRGEVWTTQSGTVVVLDGETLERQAEIPVGEGPSEITLTNDGALAFVCNTLDGTVSVLDVTTRSPVATLTVGLTPVGAWPGTDGRMYVDNEGSGTISVLTSDPPAAVDEIDLGFTPAMAAVAPTGELWVTDVDGGRVVAYDLAASPPALVRELATGAGAHAIAFAPDGRRAFVTNQLAGTLSAIDVEAFRVETTLDVGAKPNGMAVKP